jgi:Xaa-Pro dipeptidase
LTQWQCRPFAFRKAGNHVAPLPFTDNEFRRRLDGLRAARGVDAFMSFTPEAIYYLTGHDTPGYYFYQACVVTQEHRPINVLRRIETINTLGRSWSRLAVGYEDRQDPIETTLALLADLRVASRTVGAEADRLVCESETICAAAAGHRAGRGSAGRRRRARRRHARDQVSGGNRVHPGRRPGGRAHDDRGHRGIEGRRQRERCDRRDGRRTHPSRRRVCGASAVHHQRSPHEPVPQHVGGRTYRQGDVLDYELPGVVKRYCAALYRCGTVGRPAADIAQRAAVVRETLETVLGTIKPGATSQDVHSAARRVYERHGVGHLHGHRTGYSVGINYPPDWGEGQIMSIWSGDDRPLRPGMTFHLVPGFGELGRYNIVISETVLVTDTGCETVTRFPRDLFTV